MLGHGYNYGDILSITETTKTHLPGLDRWRGYFSATEVEDVTEGGLSWIYAEKFELHLGWLEL